MAYIGKLLTPEMLRDLGELADAVLPLDAWIREKTFDPRTVAPAAGAMELPWRAPGRRLRVRDTGALRFFEGLMRETSGGKDLLYRWREHEFDPLCRNPQEHPREWRAERGLFDRPVFGITRSENVLTVGRLTGQISRIDFYEKTLPDFRYCLHHVRPKNEKQWQKLARGLHAGTEPCWPGSHFASSAFVVQFTADMLYALLGMRTAVPAAAVPAAAPSDAAGALPAEVLLVELGQHRRAGNTYTSQDADTAIRLFQEKIARDLAVEKDA